MIKSYKLKNGETRWKIKGALGTNPYTGKRVYYHRRGFTSRNEAKKELLQLENAFHEQYIYKSKLKNRITLNEAIDMWLEFYKTQVKINTYNIALDLFRLKIRPTLGEYFIDMIEVKDCQKLVNHWYQTYTKASSLVSLVSRVFKFAIMQGYAKDNPMGKIIRPKNTHKEKYDGYFYDKDELATFLSIVKENESLRLYTVFHLLSYTGIRRGELLGLQWRDINFDKKTLTVNRVLAYDNKAKKWNYQSPKTKDSQRTIAIDKTTIQVLKTWRNKQRTILFQLGYNTNGKEQLVFTSSTNQPIAYSVIRNAITRTLKNSDLPYINIHGFRHTHCAILFSAGVPMHEVKARLGHASITTTMDIYNHISKDDRDGTADTFANFMHL